jgi:hypothetical protein
MPLIRQKWITRQDLRNNPHITYVFGDNLFGYGLGGQAKEMRGELNAFGIATKASPYKYLNDNEHFYQMASHYAHRFKELSDYLRVGYTVVWPEAGIGTGLADLANKAPRINDLLRLHIEHLESL